MTTRNSGAGPASVALLALSAAVLLFTGCRQELTAVTDPDQVTPAQAANAAGAASQRVAAIGNFATFYAGDVSGSGVGLSILSGLLTDEMESARGGTEHVDQRAQINANFPVTSPWIFASQANTQTARAITALRQYVVQSATRDNQIGELFALRAYTLILLGENYCNAVPIGNANDEAPDTEILGNAALFTRALELFDSATVAGGAGITSSLTNLVRVGRGRALNDLGRTTEAAAAVASVPTSFRYDVRYSESSIVNAMFDWMNTTLNFAPANNEGGNGLNYVTAADPRVTVAEDITKPPTRRGQDGVVHYTQTVYPTATTPVMLASGIEARLIEAEANVGTAGLAYITAVNAARAERTGLTPLVDPVTTSARVDQLFRERAFWFWGTAHRLGDLRRLARTATTGPTGLPGYGRGVNAVFPVGNYFKGGTYGTDVALVPSQAEQNNPKFKDPLGAGCDPSKP